MPKGRKQDDSIQRLMNLVTLIRLLGQDKGSTITELAEKTGISRWTVRRMLDKLPPELGLVEVEGEAVDRREKRYRINKDSLWTMTLPDVVLSEDERELFSVLLGIAGDIPVLGNNAEALKGKIRWVNGTLQQKVFTIQHRGKLPNPSTVHVVQTLLKAIGESSWIEYEYFAAEKDGNTKRRCMPIYLFIYEGSIYLRAISILHEYYTTYAIERFVGVPVIVPAERCIRVDEHDLEVLQDPFGPFGNREEELEVVIHLGAWQGWYANEMNWPEDKVSIEEQEDGSYLMTVRTCYRYGLTRWILQQGADAEVLSHLSLRNELAEDARLLYQKYL